MPCIINKAVAFDCATITQPGVKANVIVINHDDYLAAMAAGNITESGTTEEITAIVLTTGKKGYQFSVPKSSNIIATSPIRRVDGLDGFDHSVNVRLATIEQLDIKQISGMRFNKVVIIVQLLEGRSKVYGANVGLRLIEMEISDSDANMGNTVRFVAQTDDKEAPELAVPQLVASTVDLSTLLVAAV